MPICKKHNGNNIMKIHNDWQSLCTPRQISDAMDKSYKAGNLFRTYIPTATNPKLKNRKMLDAMDIYTYLKLHNIDKEALVTMVKARQSAIEEIVGKIK